MRSNSTWGRRPAHSGLVPPYVARPTINRGWIASGAFFAKPSLGETGFLRNSRNPNCRESVLENESLFWKIMSGADAGLVTGTTPRRTWKLLGFLRAGRSGSKSHWAAPLKGGLKMFSKRILMTVAALLTAGSFLLSDVGSSVARARDGRGGWRGGWNGGWR